MGTSFVRKFLICLQLAHLVKSGLQGYGGTKDEYSRCHGKHFRNGENLKNENFYRKREFLLLKRADIEFLGVGIKLIDWKGCSIILTALILILKPPILTKNSFAF